MNIQSPFNLTKAAAGVPVPPAAWRRPSRPSPTRSAARKSGTSAFG